MNKKQIKIDFTLQPVTDYHIGSGFRAAGILDNGLIKNGRDEPYIPASSLKGRLRILAKQLCSTLGTTNAEERPLCQMPGTNHFCYPGKATDPPLPPCLLCRLFGSPAFPGALQFHDGTLEPQASTLQLTSERAGVMINRTTRTAKSGHLFFTETGIHGLCFASHIEGGITVLNPADSHPIELAVMVAALKMLDHIGGQRSRGLGFVRTTLQSIKLNGLETSTTRALARISEGN